MTSTSTWGRWCAEHPRTIDLALTILVLLATWTAHRIALDGNETREVTVVGVVVTAIAAATIVFRRRYPFLGTRGGSASRRFDDCAVGAAECRHRFGGDGMPLLHCQHE